MATKQEQAFHKRLAEESYKEVREFYDMMESKCPEGFSKRYRNLTKAQLCVYAGIFNRDYAEYKKGVDQYERHTRGALRDAATTLTIPIISVSEEKAAEYGIGPGGFAAAPPDTCEKVFAKKLAYYKSLYNKLPRGYFKS